jgi:hypothetical protein
MRGGEYVCLWHKLENHVLTLKETKFFHGKSIEWRIDV